VHTGCLLYYLGEHLWKLGSLDHYKVTCYCSILIFVPTYDFSCRLASLITQLKVYFVAQYMCLISLYLGKRTSFVDFCLFLNRVLCDGYIGVTCTSSCRQEMDSLRLKSSTLLEHIALLVEVVNQ
jgi:hypothetical protein